MEKYIKKFCTKHSLTEEDVSRYSDEDIKYDIDFDMPSDALEQWDEYKKTHGYISFFQWTGVDNGYTPKNIDRSGIDELKRELMGIRGEIENTMNNFFGVFYDDDSDEE